MTSPDQNHHCQALSVSGLAKESGSKAEQRIPEQMNPALSKLDVHRQAN